MSSLTIIFCTSWAFSTSWLATFPSSGLAEPPRATQSLSVSQRITALERTYASSADRENVTRQQADLETARYLSELAAKIAKGHRNESLAWEKESARYLRELESNSDPTAKLAGKITIRGYRSSLTPVRQGYGLYLPPGYRPTQSYPLYIALHGGSSNGNLFLGVVLGNNMDWKTYKAHLWDVYEPRWKPPFIVAAPTGFGQVMWRWMGEQDVLDVIEDICARFSVDRNRIILGGLSNGGVGAYAIGSRHASRFAAVQAMAGAPSWLQYAGGRKSAAEVRTLEALSGIHLAANTVNTRFETYHGRTDTGPMKPVFMEQYLAHLQRNDLPSHHTWYAAGHDILYLVHRHGRVYDRLLELRRPRAPAQVRVVSGDYRAAQQHWIAMTRIENYPSLAHIDGRVEGTRASFNTKGVGAFRIEPRTMPFATQASDQRNDARSQKVSIYVDRQRVYRGPLAHLGDYLHLQKSPSGWSLGFPSDEDEEAKAKGTMSKRPGLSGPLTDAYFGPMLHVYGTAAPEQEEALKKAAERGSRGWPLWLWDFRQPVIPDRELTAKLAKNHHVVLYGNEHSNHVLRRMGARLPIGLAGNDVRLGSQRFQGRQLGYRFIYPNPEAPSRYVIVQGGTTPAAVGAANRLPDFLPDYVIFDSADLHKRPRLTLRRAPIATGYFDDRWQIQR